MKFSRCSTAFFKMRGLYDVSPVHYRQGCLSKRFLRIIVCQGVQTASADICVKNSGAEAVKRIEAKVAIPVKR